jgi:hypothetical protein
MEPKTFNEYWEEGLEKSSSEWSCKYISEAKYQWKDEKLNIWVFCKLDHYCRECIGKCSRYEKYKEKKSWIKKLFGK